MTRATIFILGIVALFYSSFTIADSPWNCPISAQIKYTDPVICSQDHLTLWISQNGGGSWWLTDSVYLSSSAYRYKITNGSYTHSETVYQTAISCPEPNVWNQDTQQCDLPPPIDCPAEGSYIYRIVPLSESNNLGNVSSDGCGYIYGFNTLGGPSETECFVTITGAVMCRIPYGATGEPATGDEMPAGNIDEEVPSPWAEDYAEEPLEVEEYVTPQVIQDMPQLGDETTIEETVYTNNFGDQVHVDNQARQVIEIDGNTYVKTTTTTTTNKSDGTVITETHIEYSNTGTTTTTTNIDTGNSTITQSGASSGSTTGTVTGNPDGSGTSTTTSTGDPDNNGEIEQESLPGQPSFDGLWEGTGIDSLTDNLKNMPGPTGQSNIESMNPFAGIPTGSCQQVTMNFFGKSFIFPGVDGCIKLAQFREVMGWAFYALTIMGLMVIATRRPV